MNTHPTNNDRHDVPTLPSSAQARIGSGLRAMYAELKAQPVPEHLLKLIGKLDEKPKVERNED
jgi:hypothetical protein